MSRPSHDDLLKLSRNRRAVLGMGVIASATALGLLWPFHHEIQVHWYVFRARETLREAREQILPRVGSSEASGDRRPGRNVATTWPQRAESARHRNAEAIHPYERGARSSPARPPPPRRLRRGHAGSGGAPRATFTVVVTHVLASYFASSGSRSEMSRKYCVTSWR